MDPMDESPPTSDRTGESSTVRYLSLDWIEALTEAVAGSERMAEVARDHRIGVTQVVTDGPEDTVVYHLQVGDGSASFGAGPAEPEHVRMEQDWDTAVAVATGELNAQEAFIGGRIRLVGDQQLLLASQPVFGALDSVFTSVREHTEYV
jgi:putative sterol carrier protein